YLTTADDPEGRPTVYSLLRGVSQWVFPVGRLDLDSSGLLMMTNDSQFAERMTNPDFKVPKTYLVKTSTRLEEEQLERLRQGVELKDGPTRPAVVERLRDSGNHTFLEITISEGRNRQVRRMLEAVESKVSKLVRVSIGPISIGDLSIGNWRELTGAEVRALQKAGAGLPAKALFPVHDRRPSDAGLAVELGSQAACLSNRSSRPPGMRIGLRLSPRRSGPRSGRTIVR
ncbi:MAG: pseudouridine synthase, partial [Acidobacteria bacterium]|nr:pseudouridine synthase [Acidobacteriota bacterium]